MSRVKLLPWFEEEDEESLQQEVPSRLEQPEPFWVLLEPLAHMWGFVGGDHSGHKALAFSKKSFKCIRGRGKVWREG